MPAPAVIPAPIAYNKVAAVETLVVGDLIYIIIFICMKNNNSNFSVV